jgi:hypothetical protein
MRILRNFAQGTDDWHQERLGRATASNAAAILDFTAKDKDGNMTAKSQEGSKRRLYRLEIVAQILSGIAVQDKYVSAPMRAGTFAEPAARAAYELEETVMVEQVGIIIGDDERTAYSPDGLVGEHGAIEIKGPTTTTHLQTLDAGQIPEGNMPQLLFAFMCCPPLQWIDFISRDGGMSNDPAMFGPILPRRYVQFTIRLHRAECEAQIAKMREATDKFLADVDATIERLKQRAPEVAEPERLAEDYGDLGLTDADLDCLL